MDVLKCGSGEIDDWETVRRGALDWEPPTGDLLVVVPHPDDEALLFGGLLIRQVALRSSITVVAVSDGEAAYPHVPPAALSERRRREQDAALDELGVDRAGVIRLGLPDGHVAPHEDDLVELLAELATPATLIVAPWMLDHHTDHEAVGRAAARAAKRCDARLACGIFWGWHHRAPSELRVGLRRLALTEDQRVRRRAAVERHTSQLVAPAGGLEPILDETVLENLSWPHEYYLLDDRRDARNGPEGVGDRR